MGRAGQGLGMPGLGVPPPTGCQECTARGCWEGGGTSACASLLSSDLLEQGSVPGGRDAASPSAAGLGGAGRKAGRAPGWQPGLVSHPLSGLERVPRESAACPPVDLCARRDCQVRE